MDLLDFARGEPQDVGMFALSQKAKPRRRWFQFSLGSLILLTTVVCITLAWLANERTRVVRREVAVARIEELDGEVWFADSPKSFGRDRLHPLLGENSNREIVGVKLSGLPVTDNELIHLARLTRLKRLYLFESQVGDAGLIHLAGMRHLEDLWLDRTLVTDAGLAHLARIRSLKSLSLNNTHVFDPGLLHLARLRSLVYLSLTGTHVTDAGLVHLANLTKLEALWLANTKVTTEGVENLRKRLPKVVINR